MTRIRVELDVAESTEAAWREAVEDHRGRALEPDSKFGSVVRSVEVVEPVRRTVLTLERAGASTSIRSGETVDIRRRNRSETPSRNWRVVSCNVEEEYP